MQDARAELAPTGVLRVGVAVGPAASASWATPDPETGAPRGVAVDLGNALAVRLDVRAEIVPLPSSGEVTAALVAGAVDVGFMPVDEDRARVVAFGPAYHSGTSTYLVPPGSSINALEDVDRPGVRVVGVEDTTTIRAARRSLHHTDVTGLERVDDILDLLREGEVDAVALGRDSLRELAALVPGTRVLDGHFWATGTAIAVGRDNHVALAFVTDFISSAKSDGTVERALASAGLGRAAGAEGDEPPTSAF